MSVGIAVIGYGYWGPNLVRNFSDTAGAIVVAVADRSDERKSLLKQRHPSVKAFNELNDPIDQRERFEKQQALRDAGDEEAQMADFEYVEAMEYGMPPNFGFGVSERLFSFLAGTSIREAQIFPLMRPKSQIPADSKNSPQIPADKK